MLKPTFALLSSLPILFALAGCPASPPQDGDGTGGDEGEGEGAAEGEGEGEGGVEGEGEGGGGEGEGEGGVVRVLLVGNSNFGAAFTKDLDGDGAQDDTAYTSTAEVLLELSDKMPAGSPRLEVVERLRLGLDPLQLSQDENRPCPSTFTSDSSPEHCLGRCQIIDEVGGAERSEVEPCICLAANLRQSCEPCATASSCAELPTFEDGQPRAGVAPAGDFSCDGAGTGAGEAPGCSPTSTLAGGDFDFVVVQVLPFGDPNFIAGVDAWREAAAAAGVQLVLFGPMPATSEAAAIPSTVQNVENALLAYAQDHADVDVIAAGRAAVDAMGAGLAIGDILELFFIDTLPDGSLAALVPPENNPGGGHPGSKAVYLYAVALYSTLTGVSPIGLPTDLDTLPACYWTATDEPARCDVDATEGLRLQQAWQDAAASFSTELGR